MPKTNRNPASDRNVEKNVSYAGLFSAVRSTKAVQRKIAYRFEDRVLDITIENPNGVPHGNDMDVYVAIQTLYVLMDKPSDVLETTPLEILQFTPLDPAGKSYARLYQALDRIAGTVVTVDSGWFDPSRRKSVGLTNKFSMLEVSELAYERGSDGEKQVSDKATLRVRLPEPVLRSLQGGYHRILDLKTLNRLKEPAQRAMYQIFDAHRANSDGSHRELLSFTLLELKVLLGLPERIDNARRTLLDSCSGLKEAGVLKEFTVEGERWLERWTLSFNTVLDPDVQIALELLRSLRVSGKMALIYAAKYPLSTIRTVVEFVRLEQEKRKSSASPVINPAGMTIDILKKPGQYPDLFPPGVSGVPMSALPQTLKVRETAAPALLTRQEMMAGLPVLLQSIGKKLDYSKLSSDELRHFSTEAIRQVGQKDQIAELRTQVEERLKTLIQQE